MEGRKTFFFLKKPGKNKGFRIFSLQRKGTGPGEGDPASFPLSGQRKRSKRNSLEVGIWNLFKGKRMQKASALYITRKFCKS